MRGICFIEPLFKVTVSELKTVTRRMNDRYKVGEVLYLKEPYRIEPDKVVRYKYTSIHPDREKWSNKMYMPEKAARHFIKIVAVRSERLQDITDEDCILEGIQIGRCGNESKWMKAYYIPGDNQPYIKAKTAFEVLINKINGAGTWERNPFVYVYEFDLTTK